MSAVRMDHVQEAVICLKDAADAGEIDEFALCDLALKAGQVHATLALVEQQRAANLLAFAQFDWRDGDEHVFTDRDYAVKLRIEVAESLGLA